MHLYIRACKKCLVSKNGVEQKYLTCHQHHNNTPKASPENSVLQRHAKKKKTEGLCHVKPSIMSISRALTLKILFCQPEIGGISKTFLYFLV